MKKLSCFALCLLLTLALCAPATAETFAASEQGYLSEVTVSLDVEGGEIASVSIDASGETPEIGGKAAETLAAAMTEAKSVEVDAVTGATYTSAAVLKAAKAALDAANGVAAEPAEPAEFADGAYTVQAAGFYGPFDLTVTVENGAIASVVAGENAETPALGGKAIALMTAEMVEKNTAMVDAVAGATLTSAAVRNAALAALKDAGAPEALLTAPAAAERTTQELSTQVLVIGSGAAGYAAAIAAREAGADVLMLEKQGVIGGSTVTSAGIVYGALGEDDVPGMVDYYMARAEQNADREQLEWYAEHSIGTVAWLTDIGVQWMFTAPSGTAPEPRANFSANMTGESLIGPLEARANELGVQLMLNTRATELTVDESGAVTGAKAEGKDADYVITAGAVVLATGGFDANEELKAQYTPVASGDFPLSSKGNVGDGLLMGIAAGADTVFNDGSIGFVIVDGSQPFSGLSSVAMGAPAYVAPDGAYLGGNVDYPITYKYMKDAGLDSCYGLYDATGLETAQQAIDAGFGCTAETVEALAEAMGADAAKLADAVAQSTLGEGPYAAVVVKPSTIGSMGGLKTNTRAEILSTSGEPIVGLYGAGEVANGGFYYHEYPASGSSISLSLTYGREAGANAAALALGK